jgi:hypothetical protein
MELSELVAEAHNHFAAQFSDFVQDQRRLHTDGAPEIKLQLKEGSGLYRDFYCADFHTGGTDGQIIEFAPAHPFFTPEIDTRWHKLNLHVSSLHWNDVEIRHDAPSVDPTRFQAWFDRWFDIEGLNTLADSEFDNVLHSVSFEPDHFSIDFGTAPPAALLELLHLLTESSADSVRISAHH